MFDVIWQLKQRLLVPAGRNAFEKLRREFSLQFVFKSKVEVRRLVGFAMAQDRFGFARIVIAVVAEENDLAADFRLQPPGRLDFGDEKAFREKPARLLAETNDGCGSHPRVCGKEDRKLLPRPSMNTQ